MRDFCGWGQEPYSDKSPVLLSYDMDIGWIVEAVNDGEYEIQNYDWDDKINEPDFELAIKEAKERGVRVRYYHIWQEMT